ncbi:decaprenyl-phosphate phosphoribosyltransferase [Nitrospira sp. KM1]|uniref:decaprenyl-phosphate phosphoribosyltransferase n=1 Tax=Nitrospira sp. KM1 TaxID=1936990 RepID=UPI0013A782C3|nr:decaprenyl-phosphate phosphoribosyltransferase [Nitrospira sp. KM1]BCA54083.1 decaprenyl-phosphate phosphoribosyltransferase [Nitrospira sp. KM1]
MKDYRKLASKLGRALRPADWIKNAFVLAPLFFSGGANQPSKLLPSLYVAIAFSLMSSSMYLVNDINDREHDRMHPKKRLRPIASGDLSIGFASVVAILLSLLAIALAYFSLEVVGTLALYGVMNVAYSLWLKHIVIVDVFSISLGFVLRVFAGGFAINVIPSSWLILATFLLSLFLALAKRRHELFLMRSEANAHRPVLEEYSIKLVDELISVVTPVTLLTYILYTLDTVTVSRFHSEHLYLTSLFVIFGIFRYLYLVHQKDLGGSPTDLVVQDIPVLFSILGWIVTFVLIVYLA